MTGSVGKVTSIKTIVMPAQAGIPFVFILSFQKQDSAQLLSVSIFFHLLKKKKL